MVNTSRADKEAPVNNMKSIDNKNIDDKYKDDNLQDQKNNNNVINKTKEENALIEWLMSMNFQRKLIHYGIDTINSGKKMIELEERI